MKRLALNLPRVKICGITREEDAILAEQAGADAIGIVFYPPSKRFVSDLGRARAIAQAAGAMVNVVALFVDADSRDIDRILAKVGVHTLQFHGDENPQHCEQFQRPYIKALRVKEGDHPEQAALPYQSASGILLDTFVAGQPGGTGQTFNWDLFPRRPQGRFILAGGLRPDNVRRAVLATQPYAVDVSGGVEASPGIKDPLKVRHFIEQASMAGRS